MLGFDFFVGIDWSGAKGNAHRGISVFICEAGTELPRKIDPPQEKRAFSRGDVIDLLQSVSKRGRVLAGIDFAFAYPVDEAGHYFSNLSGAANPQSAPALWQLVDNVNADAPDYYGGLMWDDAHYGPYYNAPNGRKGTRFRSSRRATERAASAVKSPSPTFNCVGPAGVGTGSLAGMRLCHALAGEAEIWPFTHRPEATLTLVEIFPSYYFKCAGVNPVKGAQAKPEFLNQALRFYHCADVGDDFIAAGPDHDDADALIAAAALRTLSSNKNTWQVPALAAREGWIFGVKSAKTPS